jgi:hypothetical protein
MRLTRAAVDELARALVGQVLAAADEIHRMRHSMPAADFVLALRFEKQFAGLDVAGRKTNLQELLNQVSTSLVQLAGCLILFERHPQITSLELAWQESAGWDIGCEADGVVAECYATTSKGNNEKHKDDLARLKTAPAAHRYLFYYCVRGERTQADVGGVTVWWVDLPGYLRRWTEGQSVPSAGGAS